MNILRLQILFALFIALLIWMNLLWGKIVNLVWIPVSVWIFMAPLTFLITDIVEEVYWKKIVKGFIIGWIISLIIILIFTYFFVQLEPHTRFTYNEEYENIFWNSIRIILASLVAFTISQTWDIFIFEWWKKKTKWKALWLRNNFSSMTSQLIDTFIFMTIAFYQITPKFTFAFIISMAIPYYLFKLIFAVIDTPFVYLWVKWLKKEKEGNI